ncbi:DUF5954 family protein [Actinoallomurus acaciae]|uniref:DUF5954 family protein n=1 Tax=Actinoallomurus acaciae TaxID=502577 RepID=A0ABV5Y856_9ACTN
MAFSLMPGYDHINVVADLDPVVAMRDKDLGERMRTYPRFITGGGPDFGFAIQSGTTWRIGSVGGDDPYGARIGLASHLRIESRERETDPEVRRAMMAAAGKLDPESGEQLAKDEWEIGSSRYRLIRVEKFILLGDRVMEPPRPTDVDPPSSDAALLQGHPIEPLAPAGVWEARMRLNLVAWVPPLPEPVPEMVVAEARYAIRTHPGVILLPPEFNVVEFEGDSIRRITGADGPDRARTNLAFHFVEALPRLREWDGDPATPGELAEWKKAAEQVEASPGPVFEVLGRRYCIVRVSRMMRLGRDGPEGPRPSDQDRYGWPRNPQPQP